MIKVYIEVVKLYANGKQTLENQENHEAPLLGKGNRAGGKKERGKEIKVQSCFIALCSRI